MYNLGHATMDGNFVKLSGPFKQYFDLVTVHGTYKLAGSTQADTLTGTVKYTGGTEHSSKSRVDIVEGLETFPETLLKLFSGENHGKLVLQVSPDF